MDFQVRRAGRSPLSESERVVLSSGRFVRENFGGRRLAQFSADGCRFETCAFDGVVIASGSFGAGRTVSEYIGCSFDGATLHMGPGGRARFVNCSFENTKIENWFCFAVEVVDCRFSGRLKKVVFNGAVPSEIQADLGRQVNQFAGNDFSRAELVEVAFRTGIDLESQHLPTGDPYTYLKDAPAAVARARRAFNAWDDRQAKVSARGVLTVMEEDVAEGQRQLFVRADDYPRGDRSAVKLLLAAASGLS